MARKGLMEIGGFGLSLFGAFFAFVGLMRAISDGINQMDTFYWAMVGIIMMLLGISFMIYGKD